MIKKYSRLLAENQGELNKGEPTETDTEIAEEIGTCGLIRLVFETQPHPELISRSVDVFRFLHLSHLIYHNELASLWFPVIVRIFYWLTANRQSHLHSSIQAPVFRVILQLSNICQDTQFTEAAFKALLVVKSEHIDTAFLDFVRELSLNFIHSAQKVYNDSQSSRRGDMIKAGIAALMERIVRWASENAGLRSEILDVFFNIIKIFPFEALIDKCLINVASQLHVKPADPALFGAVHMLLCKLK